MSLHFSERFSKDEETALHARMRAGDMDAKNLLAKSGLPWAMRCALRYRGGYGLGLEDLEEVAIVSVAECLNRWDPARGRLSTAIPWAVRANICRVRAAIGGPVSVPCHHLNGELRPNNPGKINLDHRLLAKRGASRVASLSNPGKHGDCQADSILDHRWSSLGELEEAEHREVQLQLIGEAMAAVRLPRDRELLRLRWFEGLTLDQCGERLGVSGARCLEIQRRARRQFYEALSRLIGESVRLPK